MRLLKEPSRPNWSVAVALSAAPRHFVEWEPFLPERRERPGSFA